LLLSCDVTTAADAGTGYLYDISGSYDNSFYLVGVCIIVSGMMSCPILCIQRWRQSRDEKKKLGPEPRQEGQ